MIVICFEVDLNVAPLNILLNQHPVLLDVIRTDPHVKIAVVASAESNWPHATPCFKTVVRVVESVRKSGEETVITKVVLLDDALPAGEGQLPELGTADRTVRGVILVQIFLVILLQLQTVTDLAIIFPFPVKMIF